MQITLMAFFYSFCIWHHSLVRYALPTVFAHRERCAVESPLNPGAIACGLLFCGPHSESFVVRRCALQSCTAMLLSICPDENVFVLIRYAIDAFLLLVGAGLKNILQT